MIGRFLLIILALCANGGFCQDSSVARHAHWVIRTSKLEDTLHFLQSVFGMKVIRHEENDEPCPITCNGEFQAAWSKTMVGYNTEDKAYSLEVTYNYGIDSYPRGTGLSAITIAVDDLDAVRQTVRSMNLPIVSDSDDMLSVVGPDLYKYVAVPKKAERSEPFVSIDLRVRDLQKAITFYRDYLQMEVEIIGGKDAAIGYPGENQVPMIVHEVDTQIQIEQWEGRHAISMPAETLKQVYRKIEEDHKDLIVHEIMELDEKLGTLFIAIVKDFDGFEICLVSSETFDKAVLEAADWKGPDWANRAVMLKKRTFQSFDTPSEAVQALLHAATHPQEVKREQAHFFAVGAIAGVLLGSFL